MAKVSFIIPLYNAALSVEETVESVINQTISDIEVILVDDASADNTVEVAKSICERDPRVKLIENGINLGVSAARNKGLDNATGEYVRFVDGDDLIPLDSTEKMVRVADERNANLVIGIMRRQSAVNSYNFLRTVKLAGKDVISRYDENLIHSFSVCNKMFRKSIIDEHGIRFDKYKHAEDGLFLYDFLEFADEKINGCNTLVYSYNKPEFFERPSTTGRLTKEMLDGILEISDKILELNKEAPQEFVDNFRTRILGVTLINEYYRQLWRLEPDAMDLLLEKIREYWELLPDRCRKEVIKTNSDLPIIDGLGDRDYAVNNPIFTFAISKEFPVENLELFLSSLYYQKMPFFSVLINKDMEGKLPEAFEGRSNIHFIDGDENFYNLALDACKSKYISFIEDKLTFTFDTLTVAHSRLQGNIDFVSGNVISFRDGRVHYFDLFEYAFGEFAAGKTKGYPMNDSLDCLLSNKFFKASSLRRDSFIFTGDNKEDLKKLYKSCSHGRYRGIRFVSDFEDDYIWERTWLPIEKPEDLNKLLVKSKLGGENKEEAKGYLNYSFKNRMKKEILFVPSGDELSKEGRELFDSINAPKTIAPASIAKDSAVKRSLYYSRYPLVVLEGMDGFLKPKALHRNQVCLPLVKELMKRGMGQKELTSYISNLYQKENSRKKRDTRYAVKKYSQYLLGSESFRKRVFRWINKLSKIRPLRKNAVLFVSDNREALGDSMEYVYNALPPGKMAIFDFIGNKWTATSFKQFIKSSYNLCTSKYIILEDFYKPTEDLQVRKGQEICQLWHACGAYKKFGYSRAKGNENLNIHSGYKKYTKVIVSSPSIRENYAEAFGITLDKVEATGIPRTDLFFDDKKKEAAVKEVYEKYPILSEKKVILFAPTYRGLTLHDADYDFTRINIDLLYKQLKDEYVFVIKWHPATYEAIKSTGINPFRNEKYSDFFLDLSHERDINKLLLVTDVMVTDYSSVIFDYLLVNKPVVFFAPDLDEYQGGRGLYYDFDEYLYGPFVETTEGLIDSIKRGDMYPEKRKVFSEKFMSSCDGNSTKKVCDYLFN